MNQSPLNKNRQDKFILVLNLPEGIKNIVDNITRNTNRLDAGSLEISIAGAVTPTISVPEKTIPYGAQTIKVSSHARPAYESLNIDFKIDNEFKNYWAIYKWLDIINDIKTGNFNEDDIIKYRITAEKLFKDAIELGPSRVDVYKMIMSLYLYYDEYEKAALIVEKYKNFLDSIDVDLDSSYYQMNSIIEYENCISKTKDYFVIKNCIKEIE